MKMLEPRRKLAEDDPTLKLVLPVVDRMRRAVEAESEEISRGRAVDYHAHSQRKSQGLLELSRMRAALASAGAHPAARAALSDLSAKLEVNQRLLQVQLKAARTVAGILARAIREGQSDGTYSAHVWWETDR